MPSLFGIGVSGLLSNQASISTTSHNIANANVEGYSRQRAEHASRTPEFIGGNFLGSGVEVGRVKRIFEQTHQLEVQAGTSSFMQLEAYLAQANRADEFLAGENSGLNSSLQTFFSAIQNVSNDPSSTTARQVMFEQARSLVTKFESIYSQLEAQSIQINQNIDDISEEITSLGKSIAQLNSQISGSPGNVSPDLLDKRDSAITRLSELVSVQTVEQSDGAFNVFVGSGQSLVVGSLSNSIVSSNNPQDPRSRILSLSAGNSSIEITNSISGGVLGGLLSVSGDILEPSYNTLGRIAISVADSFNSQNRLGMDLNNNLGGDIFTDINSSAVAASRVISNSNNVGTAVPTVTIDNPSLLNDSNYTLFLQGGNFQLVDQSNNSTIATFAAPGALPASVPVASLGITINFAAGTFVNGDSHEIQPTKNFSRELSLAITSGEQIAAASPVRGEQAQSNIGSGIISGISVTDTTTDQFTDAANVLSPPIRIQFDSAVPGEFSIYDMTTGTAVLLAGGISGYVSNQDNNMLALAGAPYDTYGYEVTLNGDPQPGDHFDINYNNNGRGDNRNAAIFSDLQSVATLDNGNSTFQQAFSQILGQIAVKTQTAQIQRDAAESILFQAKERKSSLSGVNLDEEAANLIKFQQAYEASAQVINVARTLFQTVLDSVR